MRRGPAPDVDLSPYVGAIPLLVRNPTIIVVPLLMSVIGVLFGQLFSPYGGGLLTEATGGIAALIALLLDFFGMGAACVMADDAWRGGRVSFDSGWTEARRRGGDILMAAIGVSLLLSVGQYVSNLFGGVGIILMAVIAFFLIFTIPAAAVGGIPGGAAIQVSIDRVRSAPLAAGIATAATIVLVLFVPPQAALFLGTLIAPYTAGSDVIVASLLKALIQSITISYMALVLTKTYSELAFSGRRW
ncbi:MAG TPA: hypothetical protein VMA36_19035 [Candidatus Limnocylindria bacterium]|jgi:hypothetical protein|nr:hypothetical protein [Candidatus Limnocylindria bacterium]